jgi:ring-1,2-phenylacetyl-CoA epoxidase subunit PaaC
MLLTRAAQADPALRPPGAPAHIPDEDALAYFRDERTFVNVRLVELDDDGDFATAIIRLLAYVTWRLDALTVLQSARDPVLAAIAAKAVIELTYHRDYAAGWTVRLGDGTEYSHDRAQAALELVWPYIDELFDDVPEHRDEFDAAFGHVLTSAGLARPHLPARAKISGRAGRDGVHTEAMGYLLAELQSAARADLEATW